MSLTARNAWTAAFERLAIKPAGARTVSPLGKLDIRTLPSLRGPRSPKGKRGGMTAEQDVARQLKRQQAMRQSEKKTAARRARLFVSEARVLRACMEVLEAHPYVAMWWRQNTGAGQLASGRFVKFSFRGASDLMGVLKGGAFLAVECKATGKHATPEQAAFLDNVSDAGGHSICVDDAGTLLRWLDSLNRPANGSQNATEPGK